MNSNQSHVLNQKHDPEMQKIQQLLASEEKLREFLKDNIHLVNGKTLVSIAQAIEALHSEIECKIGKADRLTNPLIYFTVEEDGSVEINPSEELENVLSDQK